jgi:hypothetical protein
VKWLWLVGVFSVLALKGQDLEVRGTIRDSGGETMPSANVFVAPDSLIASSNVDGSFSLRVLPGTKTFYVSYIGYEKFVLPCTVSTDTLLNFTLSSAANELKEITVTANRYSRADLITSMRSGSHILTQEDVRAMPVFLGEADPIKIMQLLPGISRGVEGSTDVFVRGGAADQNLVLLDGAPIYNPSHLLGFLSVFNPDVLEHVQIMTGAFPAEFGGRLSSVLNVRSGSQMPDRTEVSADIGLLSSRFKVQQPVLRNKAGFWVAGRRSYVDRVMKAVDKNMPYYFYDFNGKIILQPSKTDQVTLSHYSGDDVLDFLRDKDGDGKGMLTRFSSRNSSQTMHWRRSVSPLLTSNISLFRSSYGHNVMNSHMEYKLAANSNIEDYGAKITFQKDSVSGNTSVTGGIEWTRHEVSPNILHADGSISDIFESSVIDGKVIHEVAAHVQHEFPITHSLHVNTGLRASMAILRSARYGFPEPRLSVRYAVDSDQALKFSYSRMVQYMHRISNSTISTPIDIWMPVTDSLRAQSAHQFSFAWQRFNPERSIYLSAETYYKDMQGLVMYEEGTNLLLRSDLASKLLQGKGKAYGFEFLMRKESGDFTGWISYSLSWSWRNFDKINGGEWFPARYDRRHNGAVVMQHALGKRFAASMVWEFISGSRFTPVVGHYFTVAPNFAGVDMVPVYADVNSVKLSDSHRLDVGIKLFSKESNHFKWTWFVGAYNVYNRATPMGVIVEVDEDSKTLKYTQPGLFGLLPFVSYGCKI